ncbi:unnamed protein product [Durusdinium trenchii]|uniref:J domain-containing protein n=1 Tax=Durusdinium trenchii TaxID=1381693 RepID=A0ABP0MFE9_9DINO
MQLQMALWASAAAEAKPPPPALEVAAAEPELSQTQALLLAAVEVGDAAQVLAALEEAKRLRTMVSVALVEAAKGLQEAEEAMLTWRCLRSALMENDRHEVEVWMEHATSLGLRVPKAVDKALEALREQEQSSLNSFAKRHDLEQRFLFATECGDPELLQQIHREAETWRSRNWSDLFGQIHRGDDGRGSLAVPRAQWARVPAQWAKRLGTNERETDQLGRPPPPDTPPRADAPEHPHAAGAEAEEEHEEDGRKSAVDAAWTPRDAKTVRRDRGGRGAEATGAMREWNLEEEGREGVEGLGDLLRLLRRPPADAAPPPRAAGAAPSAAFRPAAPVAARPAPPSGGGTVWDRQVVPPRYMIHKRYASLYLLGLDCSRLPSGAELRSAYRRAAMESHPDRPSAAAA